MKKNIILCGFYVLASLWAPAKDCPSRLQPNLRPIGASPLSWGVEIRSNFFNLDGDNYWYYGLTAALTSETDSLSIYALGEYKEKKYSECQYPEDISPLKLKLLSFDWKIGRLTLSGGRQEVTAGQGLVLDDFFDGLRIAYANDALRLEAGALVLARSVAREAFSCQACFFHEYTSSWKNLKQSSWGDDKLLYADLAWKTSALSLGMLYLKSFARDDLFDFQQLGVHGRVRLPLELNLQFEASGQRFDHGGGLAFGHSFDLGRRFKAGTIGAFTLQLKHLYGSASGNTLFTPLYGNASLGERMHYSVRQGSTWGSRIQFQPDLLKRMEVELHYYQNGAGWLGNPISHEWNAGLHYALDRNKRYQFFIGYSRTRGATGVINQVAAEIRIVP